MKTLDLIQSYIRNEKLLVFPQKRKPRIACLIWISKYFKTNTIYSADEFDKIIDDIILFSDAESVKRELLNNKFISFDKEKNGYIKEKKQPKFDEHGFKEN